MIFPIWWTEDGVCACPDGEDCDSPGKHPLTDHGFKDATDSPDQIAEWRERWPRANWALATGATSRVVVVDLDMKPGKNGLENFKALGQVPATKTVQTGGGGWHLYFVHPSVNVRNSSNKLALGVDIRGDNGYVLIPPSGHKSGGHYKLVVDMEPAELPEWLLELISRPERAARPEGPSDRGYFPPATPAVLDAARAALEAHGPAIEGEGGDEHTFQAAALLRHDFALTLDEAWPLFSEWNESCRPPWDDAGLRTKLGRGDKYGTGAYGSKRDLDSVNTARRMIREWEAGPRAEQDMFNLFVRVRALPWTDPVQLGVIENELTAATGIPRSRQGMGKPKAPTGPTKPGDIVVSVKLHDVADQSLAAIQPHVFARNGMLCEVVSNEDRTFIHDLEPPRIQDLMSRHANFVRNDENKGLVTTPAPERVATMLAARRTHEAVRIIESVTTSPVFLADGSILSERGYNARARVFLAPNVAVDVPGAPDQKAARAAIALFRDLLCDYQFAEEADFASWLAGLLSPLIKAATANAPSPLICISAASKGAGKTMLADLISRIITGSPVAAVTYNPKDPIEWKKQLTSFVLQANPVVVLDNINGQIGDEHLDSLLTASIWKGRLLGGNDSPPLPQVSTWFATGNNLEPHQDTVRRVLMVRLVVDTENPEERNDFLRPALAEFANQYRARYLSAALTILRAFHVAGRPSQQLPSWGSYEVWSELVRNALVWAGTADPFVTHQRVKRALNEPENATHDWWIDVIGKTDGTPSAIALTANGMKAREILNTREDLTAFVLRRFLARFVDKPRAGKRIRLGVDPARYRVESIQ